MLGGMLAVILTIYKEHVHERLSAALRRSVMSRSEAEIAREEERQRIAADFHDGPLQSFISFQMRLEIIRKLLTRDVEAAMRELIQLQDLGRTQVTELRAFVRGMQPTEITPQTLGPAIRESVEHFERDSGVSAQLFCGDLSSVSDTIAPEVLQIVREALNNVRKHSKASRVSVVVEAGERDVEVTVNDDGSGFPFSGAYSLDELEMLRLGPRSIKRRVRTLGGDLTLDSKPSSGATLHIRIPGSR
jgi:two-component system sensor histidine kinase DegS